MYVEADYDIFFQQLAPNLIYVLMFYKKGAADIYHYVIAKVA